MNAEGEREFLAITEKEIFEEARDRLEIASNAESHDRNLAREDLQFKEGDQWDTTVVTSASMEEPELTINLTDALCRRVVNNIKQQRPRGKCHPVGDGALIEIADVINGIGRHVEYRSEVSVAYDLGAEMAVAAGWGWWRMVSEYVAPNSFDQDIRILPINNIFTVYSDPEAIMPTAMDQYWNLISNKMKRTEYKRKYPRAENVDFKESGRSEFHDWEEKESIRVAEYFRIREMRAKLFGLRGKDGSEFTRYESDMPSLESIEAAGLTVEGSRESSKRQVEWFKLNGVRVIDRRILPGSYIPVIRCQGNATNIDGKIYRRGMVRSLRDPARMVNYGEVAKIKRLGLAPKAPWVVAEGQLDGHPEWEDSNRKPVILTYKPVTVTTEQGEVVLPSPARTPPAQIEAGFAEFVQGMRTNLLAVAGMPNEPGADMQGQVISGKAISKRNAISDQSHFQYYDNQTLAIAHTWRIMLEWIPYYYSKERMQRIIGEDGMPRMMKINEQATEDGISKVKNDVSVGRYDVVMETGPGYETKREEGADTLLELMNTKLGEVVAKVGADLVFRSLDHPYMQELADRLSAMNPEGMDKLMEQLPEKAKGIVKSLMAQLQQANQALQQAQLEIKYGMDKEHVRSATKIHDTQVRAETTAHDTIVDSKTKIAVEEIRAGTAMMNDMAGHTHEAKLLITKGEIDARNSNGTGQQ